LLCPLVNEGARIIDEGIAIRSSDVDIVYVNGYGFPAYKGGPMFWAQEFGFSKVIATMEKLAATHGQRWRPAPLLERLAASGKVGATSVSPADVTRPVTRGVLLRAQHEARIQRAGPL